MKIKYSRGACCPPASHPNWKHAPSGLLREIIAGLGVEGMLCVEMFVTKQGELFVNELAPRPHNSYHQSERGCVTSQFEQAVRAALQSSPWRYSAHQPLRHRQLARRRVARWRTRLRRGHAGAGRACASV